MKSSSHLKLLRQQGLLRYGFTLIELLLVVFIAGLVAALAVPRFVNSLKGAKLRDSVRTTARMHRYARSTAVLNQENRALLFDVEENTLELVSVPKDESNSEREGFLDDMKAEDRLFDRDDSLEEDRTGSGSKEQIESLVTRTLPKGVKIAEFASEIADREIEGIYWVNYQPNGMCDPYTVRLRDPDGRKYARIEVDSVSGQVTIEYE